MQEFGHEIRRRSHGRIEKPELSGHSSFHGIRPLVDHAKDLTGNVSGGAPRLLDDQVSEACEWRA
ncbi:hypothetical protein GCM10023096_78750 [Nonomuraea ferruginea]